MALGITETYVPFSPAKGKRLERGRSEGVSRGDRGRHSLSPWRPFIRPPRPLLPCPASSILQLREDKNPSNDDRLCDGSPVSRAGGARSPVEVAAARRPVSLVPWLATLVISGSAVPGITCYGSRGSVLVVFFFKCKSQLQIQ